MTTKRKNDNKTVTPSSSYQLRLPEKICGQNDERVSSFWLDGAPLLLQLSSYIRSKGTQLTAEDRLKERIKKHDAQWNRWKEKIHPNARVDQATAEFTDDDGLLWIHSYLVWPHLTVYSIISGPETMVRNSDNWALESLKSLRLTTH
jgi:hypothetical protein